MSDFAVALNQQTFSPDFSPALSQQQLTGDATGSKQSPVVQQASGAFSLKGIQRSLLAGSNPKHNFDLFDSTSVLVLSPNTTISLGGMTGGWDGRVVLIACSSSASGTTGVRSGDTGSTATNRFAETVPLPPGSLGVVVYDGTSQLWVPSAVTAGQEALFSIADSQIGMSDVTTGNVDTSAHGYAPKAPGDSTQCLDGNASYSPFLNATAVISPTQLSGGTNNWNPTGLSTASAIRLSTDATRVLTGITAPSTAKYLNLLNIGSNTATIVNESGSSTNVNRFTLKGGTDFSLTAGGSLLLFYDTTSTRWRGVANT